MTLYNEMLLKLDYLCNEIETRESVAKWAFSMLNDNDLVIDQIVWNTLVRMGAVDIIDVNGKDGYLYTKEDFKEWSKILK